MFSLLASFSDMGPQAGCDRPNLSRMGKSPSSLALHVIWRYALRRKRLREGKK